MTINPDQMLRWEWSGLVLNATLLFTWLVMALLVGGSWLLTRRLSHGVTISRTQHLLELVVLTIRKQVQEVSQQKTDVFLPFVGTLFLFIAMANLLTIIPGYVPPTGSLSTTAALAACVFVAVPLFGISRQGVRIYLRQYLQPTWLMLPFNILGEFTRTLSLAMRLYGNMMSGVVIGMILLATLPLFVPVVMQLFGLLTGMIQAYIFAILSLVYIASAAQAEEELFQKHQQQ